MGRPDNGDQGEWMGMADVYSILGVAKGASEADIKKAYRKLAKELHPDRNKDNPKATARFSEVTAAYDLLCDPAKRAQYDRGEIDAQGNPAAPFGYGGGQGGGFGGADGFSYSGDAGDIFSELFGRGARGGRGGGGGGFDFGGGGRRAAPRGRDVAYRLAVRFEDAATLAPQRITLSSGKTIDLKLPAGFSSDKPLRLNGQGEAGPGGAGDALVTIIVQPHSYFTREGDDVRLNLPVSLKEAVEGARVKVPTVDGPVMLAIPEGSSSGRVLRLRGKGFHKNATVRGDQLVTLMVDLPAQDGALKSFVENWESGKAHHPRAIFGLEG